MKQDMGKGGLAKENGTEKGLIVLGANEVGPAGRFSFKTHLSLRRAYN